MKNEVLVIIPAYNEAENIESVIKELKENIEFADILIINDYSKDNTVEILKSLKINYLTLPFNLGYSSALQSGFKYAVDNGYSYVIQFDGDGQHIASEGLKLFNKLKDDKLDIIIGSRFKVKGKYKNSLFRSIGTKLFQNIIYSTCKVNITDPTSGFQVLNSKVFNYYSKINNYPEFPDANLIIDMLHNGYKIAEIQVDMREREFGVSMHSGIIKPIKYMINMFYSIIIIYLKNFLMLRKRNHSNGGKI